ncbi:phage portal protein, partial [Clostridium sp. PL3]|nr:phage portal protein [Clostridium thailandense]
MKFLDWIKDFFTGDKSTVYLNEKAVEAQEIQLEIEAFAISSAIDIYGRQLTY